MKYTIVSRFEKNSLYNDSENCFWYLKIYKILDNVKNFLYLHYRIQILKSMYKLSIENRFFIHTIIFIIK